MIFQVSRGCSPHLYNQLSIFGKIKNAKGPNSTLSGPLFAAKALKSNLANYNITILVTENIMIHIKF